jgi:hypothetical protein
MHVYLAGVHAIDTVLDAHPLLNAPQDLLACVSTLCIMPPAAKPHPIPLAVVRRCMDRFYAGFSDVKDVHVVIDTVRKVDVMTANKFCLYAMVMCGVVPWVSAIEKKFPSLRAQRMDSSAALRCLQPYSHLFTSEAFRAKQLPDAYLVKLYGPFTCSKELPSIDLAYMLGPVREAEPVLEAAAAAALTAATCTVCKFSIHAACFHAFQLPCGHSMHAECLMIHVTQPRPKCPTCRTPLCPSGPVYTFYVDDVE